MEKGKLFHKGGAYFLPDGEKYPKLYTKNEMEKHNAVMLPPSPYAFELWPEFPTAHICRSCAKIIVEY
jgi:hypothetical protein